METLIASEIGKAKIAAARIKKGWKTDGEEPISEWRQKFESPELTLSESSWKRFYYARNAINAEKFRQLCEILGLDWKEIVDRTPTLSTNSFTHPLEPSLNFYGRDQELEELEDWFSNEGCLITLYGPGGIGKTALATKIVKTIAEKFDEIIIENFVYDVPIQEMLNNLPLTFRGGDLASRFNQFQLTQKLIHKLQSSRTLILFDEGDLRNAEVNSQEYLNYQNWFKQLSEFRFEQSFIVLTVQEVPPDMKVTHAKVKAIGELNAEAIQKILKSKNLELGLENCNKLIRKYGGNPAILKMAAARVIEYFDGDIDQFLEYSVIDEELIKSTIQPQIDSLTPLEQKILRFCADFSDPISLEDIKKEIEPEIQLDYARNSDFFKGIHKLNRRSLLEKHRREGEILYSVSTMIKKVVSATWANSKTVIDQTFSDI